MLNEYPKQFDNKAIDFSSRFDHVTKNGDTSEKSMISPRFLASQMDDNFADVYQQVEER